MKESEFVATFESAAQEVFKGKLDVKRKAKLLYSLNFDENLDIDKSSKFETDVTIFENGYPRVVIEFKPGISSHDVIIYSTKAGRHKKVYPGLRYGLLSERLKHIPDRFFLNNENLDFFIAASDYTSTEKLYPFIRKLIEQEVESSRTLEKIYLNKEKFNFYRTEVFFNEFK